MVESERAERAAGRVGRYAGYAENAATRSAAAETAARRVGEHIPFGQPILVGHHSQRRAERDRDRIGANLAKSAEEERKANYWAGRTETAERSQEHRENIPTTLRRIDRLEAELRGVERDLTGRGQWEGQYPDRAAAFRERLGLRQAQLAEQVAYWKAHVEAAEADGLKVWRQEDFAKGDQIQCGGTRWHLVVRANKRTLSVQNPTNPGLKPLPLPYDKVTGRRPSAAAES